MGASQSQEEQLVKRENDLEEKKQDDNVDVPEEDDMDDEILGNPANKLFHLLRKNDVDVNAVRDIVQSIKEGVTPEKNLLNMADLPPTLPENADPKDPLIIRMKERIAKKTYLGDTALHYLVGRNPKYNTPELVNLVKIMFLKNASLSAKNKLGATALHRACAAGNAEMARELIRWAADVNETTDMGLTCLHMACYAGHTEVVKLLLENNCAKHITYKCKYGLAPCDYVLKDEIYQMLKAARMAGHRGAPVPRVAESDQKEN